MPGVSDVAMTYKWDLTAGATFTVGVTLDRSADAAQAVAVGRTFVEENRRKGMGGVLSVSYPTGWLPAGSATFDCGQYGSPSADDVADSLRVWLRAVHQPGAQKITLTQPSARVRGRDASITVTPDVTLADAVGLGRIFAENRPRHTSDGEVDTLSLTYPAHRSPATPAGPDSVATFTFEPSHPDTSPSVDQVADNVATWLHAARSPIVDAVTMTQPPSNDAAVPVQILLAPETTAAAAIELQRADAGLSDASWTITVTRNDNGDTDDYTSTPHPPSDHDRALWSQISEVVGPYFEARGASPPHSSSTPADTEVLITVDRSADTDVVVERITTEVPPLLRRFGHPSAMLLHTPDGPIEIVVGGCHPHQPDHQRLPLERELSRQYEQC